MLSASERVLRTLGDSLFVHVFISKKHRIVEVEIQRESRCFSAAVLIVKENNNELGALITCSAEAQMRLVLWK